MSYLVCDKCNGYYELQEGESPEGFDLECKCGGTLKHVQNFNPNRDIKSNYSNEIKVCPVCSGKNSAASQICVICGKKFDDIPTSIKANPNPHNQDFKPFTSRFMELLNGKAIIAGCIIFAAAFVTQGILIGDTRTFYAPNNIMFLEVLIGGIAAGYAADPKYRTGIFNGILYGLIATVLFLTFIIVDVGVFPYIPPFFTVSMILSGSFGALIGTTFQKMIIATNGNKQAFLVCDSCGGYYEPQPGEFSESSQNLRFWNPKNEISERFNNKCECGGTLKYVPDLNDADKLMYDDYIGSKLRFHPVISISTGLIVFFVLFMISSMFGVNTKVGGILAIVSFVIGGFISTYSSKEKKIRYGFYTGLLIAVLFGIMEYSRGLNHLLSVLNGFIEFPLLTSIGGFIGIAVYEHLRHDSDSLPKNENHKEF